MPVITMLDEHNVAAFNKVYDMMSDKDHVAYLENYYRWDDWTNGEKFYNQFYEGRALFYANLIGSLNKQSMQNSSVRFGVLPLPKYEESQSATPAPSTPTPSPASRCPRPARAISIR